MPRSHNRKSHYKHTHIDYVPHAQAKTAQGKIRKSSVSLAMILCTVFAMGIAWFASNSIPVLIIGAAVGLVGGYYGGKALDRSFDKA